MPYTEGAHDSPADTLDQLHRVGSKYQATAPTVADGDNVYLLVDSAGRLLNKPYGGDAGASEIKTVRAVNTSSTTKATVLTPASGKKVRIISVNIDFTGATSNGLEVYFGTGTDISTNAGKEITEGRQAAIGPIFEAWPDGGGPIGAADDIVTMRGTASVAEAVNIIIAYREE